MNLYVLERHVARAFGQTLEEARIGRGMSRATLAARSGIGHGAPRRLEWGSRDPTLGILLALARGLEIPPEGLLAGTVGHLEEYLGWITTILGMSTFGLKRLYRLANRNDQGQLQEDWTCCDRWRVAVQIAHEPNANLQEQHPPFSELVVYVQCAIVSIDFTRALLVPGRR